MTPEPGQRLVRYVGDRVRFVLSTADGMPLPSGWQVRLRTNLGRVNAMRNEVIAARGGLTPYAAGSWRDIAMQLDGSQWVLDLPLVEIGWFRAKAYALDPQRHQHWPPGEDIGIAVQPDACRTGNTIYCAFTRQFGSTRSLPSTTDALRDESLALLDRHGYTAIPASGTLRDLTAQLPHIADTLGCRILHLLPVTPTPTVYARMGRFGSPYAGQDLTAIDPALVVFDKATTGVDQFRERTYAAHLRGMRVFLDVVLNHTGWGSTLQDQHPEWFRRNPDGTFHSPGAWGTTWEDLVELDHHHRDLWDVLADSLVEWCRRGVDGFRCDAGYMVPCEAWQYITAKVRVEFPDAVFLLEGLGGGWDTTATLLTHGGLQWAYSELFQNYDGQQVSSYVDHIIRHNGTLGTLINYSETHDNERLASKGRTWSLLRNRLCGLTSTSGGFGFTAGVEWLATERIDVHHNRSLSWDSADNIVAELGQLNRLLLDHPCFFDGVTLQRLSAPGDGVVLLRRDSADGLDQVLVIANLDPAAPAVATWTNAADHACGMPRIDVISGDSVVPESNADHVRLALAPGAVLCLASSAQPKGLTGDDYRRRRALAAAAYRALHRRVALEDLGPIAWQDLAALAHDNPVRFLGGVARLVASEARRDLKSALLSAMARPGLAPVIEWGLDDIKRVVPVPPGFWLLVRLAGPFVARITYGDGRPPRRMQAVFAGGSWIAGFPGRSSSNGTIEVEPYDRPGTAVRGALRFLGEKPSIPERADHTALVLLTNGRGGMARINVDPASVQSKYDCVLGANLHASVPVDRHVLIKRLRLWVVADGFITPLNHANLAGCEAGPPGVWRWVANAGDGRTVEIHLHADLIAERNTVLLRFSRPRTTPMWGLDLPDAHEVRLTVRCDLEDRIFHSETLRTSDSEMHLTRATSTSVNGFDFSPAPDRVLRVRADTGEFHADSEWCIAIPHPVEASRGMNGSGDAWSPGWFDLPMPRGAVVTITGDAESSALPKADHFAARAASTQTTIARSGFAADDGFGRMLANAAHAFVVRRDAGHSVIAGYPWFLDWGRDTLICARGLLALGWTAEVRGILRNFGRFEADGTLPNCIHGEDASNRDTSDAPLWYGVVCEDAAALLGAKLYRDNVGERTIAEVLIAIATGYRRGTPNGIRMDADSGLIWSPRHFTWMDTNYPTGTPREGYPVEIQVLWIRLLRQLERIGAASDGESWGALAERAQRSFIQLFWLPKLGWLADVLIAPSGLPAAAAIADQALRSNGLFAVSLGLLTGEQARSVVAAAQRHLVVPGALRSLAPLPVQPPLPIRSASGVLLNDPDFPYWGHYQGDEDTQRKPAYHNGTAWVWTFPTFCEALVMAWDDAPEANAAARAYLGSLDTLLAHGCLGQLPEIIDGDAPHTQRGCDAQAWSVTEAARVWKVLNGVRKSQA